ncbi:radical SAM family heme chaperone HemW [Balnearium lithotrophicum]|uniref:radical SAM family heme chaperone HemW n=1 Tax=Balnearium lithotrophicum TaxID=223788 RepID=UPI00115C5380|nr:radical SAM family heme chaperone HemW [Balnearium lithotrophicum]
MRRNLVNSLYVHVPFCRKKCPYCDFYSGNFFELKDDYKKAIFKELSIRAPEFSQFPTVYFGGGTPSLMEASFFETLLSKLSQFSEVTVEVNPEDAKRDFLSSLNSVGVNRISLGVQSFSDKFLKFLGRGQNREDNVRALEETLSLFSNVSADIIYGIPGQSIEEFLEDLEFLLKFPVKHVSLYALTIYEGTPFEELLNAGKFSLPEEEKVSKMYYEAVELLESRGFKQYEISNFSVPGFESKHNLSYWRLENYVGLGPSAASFEDGVYTKNISDIGEYISKINEETLPIEEREEFRGRGLKEIKLIMGLRLTEGVDVKEIGIEEEMDRALKSSEVLKGLIDEGYLIYEFPKLKLDKRAYFTSNAVISLLIKELWEV